MKMKPKSKCILAGSILAGVVICMGCMYAANSAMEHFIDTRTTAAQSAAEPAGDVLLVDDIADLDDLQFLSAEEADMIDAEIVFDDEKAEELKDSEVYMEFADQQIRQEMATIRYGSKIYYNWSVGFMDSVYSTRFTMNAGQYLYINASYTPANKSAYIAYTTPDKKVHVIGNGGAAVSKAIHLTQTGYYRLAFMNRSSKRLYVAGYYKKST